MDPAAIERAREKAQAVRASLQQKQQSIVDRRRQQEQKSEPSAAPDATAATPATASGNAAATEVPPLASRADDPARESTEARGAAERPSGPASRTMPPPPVMEDFTASANDDDDDSSSSDDEDDTGSTFHDDEESSTTQGTGAPTVIAATATINEVPQAKEVRFSLSHVTPVSDEPMSRPTNDASAEATTIPPFEPLQQRRQIVAGGSLRSASVTRQVLSSPDSDSDAAQPREPRYLRYRDSLRTSLQKSATSANAARDSLASSDDTTPIKNQLLSYFDKSLPPATASGSGTAGGAASEAMPQEEITSPTTLNEESDEGTGKELALGSSTGSLSQDPITVQTAPITLSSSSPPTDEAERAAMTTESTDNGNRAKKSQGRAVSFDPSSTPPSLRIVEDLSESESSFQAGTFTARQYRRRRAMQLGALALLLVILPLAIGLGVAYSNRPSSSSTSQDSAVPESSSNPTLGPMIPTVAPSAALGSTPAPTIAPVPPPTAAPALSTDLPVTPSPTLPPTEIVFAPVTSILDLLVANNSTRRDL